MFGRFGIWEILVIVFLVMILFGSAKIPGMMKNLANGIKTFKKELKPVEEKSVPVAKKPVAKKSSTGKKTAVKKTVKK